MVHFPGFARPQLWIHWGVLEFYPSGFPHSEIPGSKPACGSPRLIAACHVLHRLLLPRHPPCALSSLTIKFTRHTAAWPPAFSFWLSAFSKTTPRLANSTGLDPAHRTQHRFSRSYVRIPGDLFLTHHRERSRTEGNPRCVPQQVFSQALIKIYSLVDCPIYSVVKYRPLKQLSAVSLQRSAKDLQPRITSVPASAGLGLTES